jgi:glycosyltransferase involved in cell wall biosynthesis
MAELGRQGYNAPMPFSVVIPTYKRPGALIVAFRSVLSNTRIPTELIIIDDDAVPEDMLSEMRKACTDVPVSFQYHKKDHTKMRRGLSESKNWAAELARHDVIFYLDDDVELDTEYFAEMMKVWKEHWSDEKLVGMGGRVANNRKQSWFEKRIFNPLFGLSGKCVWDVNDVGFQVWDESVSETQRAYYMHGGVSSYRRTYIQKDPFAVFAGGRTALEDVEYCLRAKRAGYYFFYVPSAYLTHYPKPHRRESRFSAGVKESQNRKYIFRTLCPQNFRHRAWFLLANMGWILKKKLTFKLREALGLFAGLIQ